MKEGIEALESRKRPTETNGGYIDERSSSLPPEWTGRDLNPRPQLAISVRLTDDKIYGIIHEFSEWLEIDELGKRGTIHHHVSWIKRLLKEYRRFPLRIEDYRGFLKKWKGKAGVYHYSNAIKSIRVFTRYLGCEEIGKSFKFPRIDRPIIFAKKKEDLQKFYSEGLERLDDKTFFLIAASSGLRRHEVASLTPKDIDLATGMVVPNKEEATFRGTKNTYATFINLETRTVLKQLIKRKVIEENQKIFDKGFGKSGLTYRWNLVSDRCKVKITPSDLRDWFCNEMGRLGVADRYIDAFCGRVPKSVIAQHYTDYSLERLEEIYDKADLKVLTKLSSLFLFRIEDSSSKH